jgi:hypothetical protein
MDISGITSSSGLHAASGASTGAPSQQKMSNLFAPSTPAAPAASTASCTFRRQAFWDWLVGEADRSKSYPRF